MRVTHQRHTSCRSLSIHPLCCKPLEAREFSRPAFSASEDLIPIAHEESRQGASLTRN